MNQVGYLIQCSDGLHGSRGPYYDYLLAGNGLFIEARSSLLSGRAQVAKAQVRGLPDLQPDLKLVNGLIPGLLWELAMNAMLVNSQKETFVAIQWVKEIGRYILRFPEQKQGETSVVYQCLDNIVLEIHSHASMRAFFSPQDNADEQGFRIYCVIGKLSELPQVRLRLGIYGYHQEVSWSQVFAGSLSGVIDLSQKEEAMTEMEYTVFFDGKEHAWQYRSTDRELVEKWAQGLKQIYHRDFKQLEIVITVGEI